MKRCRYKNARVVLDKLNIGNREIHPLEVFNLIGQQYPGPGFDGPLGFHNPHFQGHMPIGDHQDRKARKNGPSGFFRPSTSQ